MKRIRIVMIFHGKKVPADTLEDKIIELRANPQLSLQGMTDIQNLVNALRPLGPFASMYSSRLARALVTASTIMLALDLDCQTMTELGQYATGEGGESTFYPGHENEWYAFWQTQVLQAMDIIYNKSDNGETILVVSHRPHIAALYANVKGVKEEEKIRALALDPNFSRSGFIVFEIIDGIIYIPA
ncbi:MAG: phosphoglycerate mutase family protein [Candidatus Berkelbacteria bacterium]|nr:phosphoglycerate mutase family protein [Candidatus Berkelbacteria bacterium]